MHLKRAFRSIWRRDRGSVAIEFAFALPVLIIILMGVYDTTEYLVAERRLSLAANAIGQIATTYASQSAIPGLTGDQAQKAMDAMFVYLPTLKTQANSDYGAALTSVAFTGAGCATGGGCTGQVMWSVVSAHGSASARGCGTVATGTQGPNTVPNGAATPAPVFIVDLNDIYTPRFTMFLPASISIYRSVTYTMRSGADEEVVTFDGATCPAYTAAVQAGN